MTKILALSALELSAKIKNKELTVMDAIRAVYRQIDIHEANLHCYITIRNIDEVLTEAEQIQSRIEQGELSGPLSGVPIAIKDNICTKGLRTTCASRMLEHFVPTYSATVIERLQDAGLIIIGKTNMDEFGMGSTTESSAFGITRNPHHQLHSPGGSSGGSCAAVAAKEAFLALGSDTGGSIRQPAAHCGVFGMKPTYGTVSRYGLVAYASSLDQIGPIGKTAEDCQALLDIIRGQDSKDATTIPTASADAKFMTDGLKVGIPMDFFTASESSFEPLSPAIRTALTTVSDHLKDLGVTVNSFPFGLTEYLLPAYYIIACAEASSNLSRYDGVKYGYHSASDQTLHSMYRKTRSEAFGEEVKKRILLGNFTLSSGYYDDFYIKAQKVKNHIVSAFEQAFATYDFLLLPVTSNTAPPLSAYKSDPVSMYRSDLFTVPANLAGLPAVSIPSGTDSDGLPIGIQIIGKRGSDFSLLKLAGNLHKTC